METKILFCLLFQLICTSYCSPLGVFQFRDDGECTSVQCLERAYLLKSAIDFDVDPCDDFYKFACGNYINTTSIPEDKTRVNAFSVISDQLLEDSRVLLETPIKEGQPDWMKLPGEHFKACMDEEAIEEMGIKPMQDIVQEVGGWDNDKKWYELQIALNKLGIDTGAIVNIAVEPDFKFNTKRAIDFDQPYLGLSREYYVQEDDKARVAYLTLLEDILTLFEVADAEKTAKKIFDFEKEIALATKPKEERRDQEARYNPETIKSLEQIEGHPPSWLDYINGMLNLPTDDLPSLTSDEKIIVGNPEYLTKFAEIMQKADHDVVNKYILVRAVSGKLDYLSSDARDIYHKYVAALYGLKKEEPRWKKCVKYSGFNTYTQGLTLIASRLYVDKHFTPQSKKQMEIMVSYLRKAFKGVIDEIEWMDDKTKEEAYKKLDGMHQMIGYPDELLDDKKMADLHKGIEIDEKNFFGNMMKMGKFWSVFLVSQLRDEIDRSDWLDNSVLRIIAVVNAFYSPNSNTMVFPAGILKYLMFENGAPNFMNYAAIGGVIGHEISHGFDDQGRQSDHEGVLRNWWSEETLTSFKEKTKCVIDQYSEYESSQVKMKVNGVTTQGENIADIVGFKIAYKAYEYYTEDFGVESGLPGLHFSPRQMFWLSNARTWCSVVTDQALADKILTDPHSPNQFRIWGPLSNNPDFARDYNCPVGSNMNPEKKCTVW